jgi:uncharacterized protein Yka (UPF0111/DUF47 family)
MVFMNYLVFLDAQAGELEKILSGVKTMLAKKFDPAGTAAHPINPGDSLYFLRDQDDCAVRVKATVVRVLFFTNNVKEDLSLILKAMQPRLQLTEAQYNAWAARQQVMLVEFASAHKIGVIHVAPDKITDRSDWIAFQVLSRIIE